MIRAFPTSKIGSPSITTAQTVNQTRAKGIASDVHTESDVLGDVLTVRGSQHRSRGVLGRDVIVLQVSGMRLIAYGTLAVNLGREAVLTGHLGGLAINIGKEHVQERSGEHSTHY